MNGKIIMRTKYAIYYNVSIKNQPFFSKSSNVAATVPFFIDLSEFHILNGRDSDIAGYHSTSVLANKACIIISTLIFIQQCTHL